MTQQQIADIINVDQSTISRELSRNTGQRGYRHKQAQQKNDERRRTAAKSLKMTPDQWGQTRLIDVFDVLRLSAQSPSRIKFIN